MDFDDIPAANEEAFVVDDEEVPEVPEVPPPVPDTTDSSDAPYTFIEVPPPEPTEDALTKFNREWQARIEEKRAAEFEFEKQVRAKAQEELAAWKHQRDVRLAAKKDKNRSEQQNFVETRDSEAQNLKVWDRVGKLIDANETEQKGSDTGRMKKLFIHLKNEPLEVTRAAAAEASV